MKKRMDELLVYVFLVLSLFAVLSVKFLFAKIPERWEYGYETGEILYNLSLAYIASYIFYIIIIKIPERRNQKNINDVVGIIVSRITYSGLGMLHGLSNTVEDREKILSKEEFKKLCIQLGPESIYDYFWTIEKQYPITYIQHLNSLREYVKSEAQTIFIYSAHLDTELIKLINDVLNSPFMGSLNAYFKDERYQHPTFETVSSAFFDFYNKVAVLKEFKDRRM